MGKYKIKSHLGMLKEAIEGNHSKRVNAILHTCDDEQFCVNYFKMLEYVRPKMQRAEVVSKVEDQVITIVHCYQEAK